MPNTEKPTLMVDALVFRIGSQRCALRQKDFKSIDPLGPITNVPSAPKEIAGATPYRGQVTVVIDLGKLLGLVSQRPKEGDSGILLSVGDYRVLLYVGQIEEMRPVPSYTGEEGPTNKITPYGSIVLTPEGELLLLDPEPIIRRIVQLMSTSADSLDLHQESTP